jgi:PmbA protein
MDKILKELKKNADSGEVYALSTSEESVTFENDKLKKGATTQRRGVAVRVIANGRVGFSTATRTDDASLLVRDAVQVAEFGESATFEFAPKVEAPKADGLHDPGVAKVSMDQMVEMGRHVIDKIKAYDSGVKAHAGVHKDFVGVELANTNGLELDYKKTFFSAYAAVTLAEENNIFEWWEVKSDLRAFASADEAAEELIRLFAAARKNVSFEGGSMPVILTPRCLPAILSTLEAGVSAEFVAKGMSPIKDKLGQEIFDGRVTVYEDPAAEGLTGCAPFDDEGVPTRKKPVVENGVLKSYLGNLKYCKALGIDPTGNGMREQTFGGKAFAVMPGIGFTNVVMQGGDMPLADMIADIKKGLLIEAVPDAWMGNVINGDFAGSIYLGLVIENGKITGRAKDLAIAGNIYKVFKDNIVALSRETQSPGDMSNFSLPWVYLKDMPVSGRA